MEDIAPPPSRAYPRATATVFAAKSDESQALRQNVTVVSP